ncbi:MAG: DUF6701 domain-containing protein [Aquabacterium sp.]
MRSGPALSVLLALLLWLLCAAPGQAATYTFRSDTYAWESAATLISWDRTCTSYAGDDDKATITFTGGFSFRFAGVAYSSARVMTNGMLQFGTDAGLHRTYTNTAMPIGTPGASSSGCARAAPANVMAAYWTDLDPGRTVGGGVYWEQKGSAPNRYVVVSWNNVYQYGTSTPYTFQIILYEGGEFKYQYGNANASGSNATIGVQISATDYTLYSYNSGYNANGSAIRWFIPSGAPGRKAEYRFDEFSWSGVSGEVKDASGNNNHGTRVGSATSAASGVVCRRLDVPANTTTAISAIDTALDIDTAVGNSGTLSFWYRGNAAWNSGTAAMLMSASMSATRPFYLQKSATGQLQFVVSDSAGTALTATAPALATAAGTWTHVAATWRYAAGSNQSTLRLYVNGVQQTVATGTTNGALDPSIATLFVGDNRSTATPAGATTNSANGQLDELRVYNFELSAAEIALDLTQTHDCNPPIDHLEVRHASGTGLTCTPSTVTVAACQDASCATPYTGGLTGVLTATGGVTTNFPTGASFTIPAGSSQVDVSVQLVSAGSTTLGISGASPSPTNAASCNFGSPRCTFTAADAGLLLSVPAHVAERSATLTVSAVRRSDNAAVCVPAFASVTRAVTVSCSYRNPSTGTLPVRVASRALNASGSTAAACDGTAPSLSLSFNASGVATTTLQYADAGEVSLTARHVGTGVGDLGLTLSGSVNVIAAPASLAISGVTAGPIKAGRSFNATVTARNDAGTATPNFGRESTPASVALSFARSQPTGTGASNGSFSGSLGGFSSGAASASNLAWTEVGRGDLTATLSNYLGTGLGATASTSGGAVGRFIPDHFTTTTAAACGAFSYAGQPFTATLTARNAAGNVTTNYDGSASTSPNFAQAVTLTDAAALGLGSFNGTDSVPASTFRAGVGAASPAYTYTSKLGAPATMSLRASDADAASSAGRTEGSMALRSGRLRLSNASGAETAALQVPVTAEYWSGSAWVPNGDDACTTVPEKSVVLANRRDARGAATSAWTNSAAPVVISGGRGILKLGAPNPGGSGSLEIALNLGSKAVDASCLTSPPASAGAALPWLRSQNGACATTYDRDPSARVSFGIYSPEARKTVHVRELF